MNKKSSFQELKEAANKTINEMSDGLTIDFYKDALATALADKEQLELMLDAMRQAEGGFRDSIAALCFAQVFGTIPSNKDAAVDSYRAADAFLRVKEEGEKYESEIVEDIKDMVKNTPNDQALGELVRKLYR
jgi:hypothetical protein